MKKIGAVCLSAFDAPGPIAPVALTERVWSEADPTVAALLAACEKAAGDGRDIRAARLETARERAANVPGPSAAGTARAARRWAKAIPHKSHTRGRMHFR